MFTLCMSDASGETVATVLLDVPCPEHDTHQLKRTIPLPAYEVKAFWPWVYAQLEALVLDLEADEWEERYPGAQACKGEVTSV